MLEYGTSNSWSEYRTITNSRCAFTYRWFLCYKI